MWTIVLHGGAKEIEPDKADANRRGCLAALAAGREILAGGGSSIDAVEAAIRSLEEDPTFNAGYGSALNAAGEVEMCSALMEGGGHNVGGVSVIQGVRHPISVARQMLFDEPILISGPGARRYAEEHGLELRDNHDLVPPREGERHTHDTVGCIALDAEGRIAVGTSTGGLDGSPVGRVGDSPQPGCGFYADDAIGAVAFSGDGEDIARKMLAARVMFTFDAAHLDDCVRGAIDQVAAVGGEAGGIALAPNGEIGWHHNSRDFAVALQREGGEPQFYLRKGEDHP